MKKLIKAHPLMIFDTIKPLLFFLILPAVNGILQYIKQYKTGKSVIFFILLLLLLIIIAVLKWKSFKITVLNCGLLVENGILIKETVFYNWDKVSGIFFKQNLIEKLFNAQSIIINTQAENSTQNNKSIRLYSFDADYIKNTFFYEKSDKQRKFSFLRVLFWAATASSTVTGIVIGLPVINKAISVLGIGLYELLLSSVNKISNDFKNYMPKTLNLLTFSLITIYIIAFLYQLFKNLNFSLNIGKKLTFITSGFFVKRQTVFKKSAVNNITFDQTLLMYIFKKLTVRASVGGYSGRRTGEAVIAPAGSRSELFELFSKEFEFFCAKIKKISNKQLKYGVKSVLILPIVVYIIVTIVLILIALKFKPFIRLIVLIDLLLLFSCVFWSNLLIFSYKKSILVLNKKFTAVGTTGFKRREIFSYTSNIGFYKLKENPFDRKRGSCKAKITIFSQSADTITLRWLKKDDLLKTITQNEYIL